jgi:anti-sigma factor RsiW
MTETIANDPRRVSLEELLPFYANGRISTADRARVEAALAGDAELAQRLEIIREDMAETILLNESLGGPSPRALDKLMAAIEAEPQPRALLARTKGSIVAWFGNWIAAQPPRRLAYASAAALALIAIQGVALTGYVINRGATGGYETASVPGAAASDRYVLLSFAPDAKASDIAGFFKRYDASVVDGPRANGFFKVRVGGASLTPAQVDAIAARMKAEAAIVSFVAPAP